VLKRSAVSARCVGGGMGVLCVRGVGVRVFLWVFFCGGDDVMMDFNAYFVFPIGTITMIGCGCHCGPHTGGSTRGKLFSTVSV
jgi:hypothetical protein